MTNGSTLFLKVVICLIGLVGFSVCAIILGNMFFNPDAGMYLPILILIELTAIPFFYALYQGLLLLRYIEKNTAFSQDSVTSIQTIKYCAVAISALYAAGMPYIVWVAERDDAPGAVLIALLFISAPLIVSVFAAVLQKLLQQAIDIKSENDLTV